jgi:hypothetical protein
MSYEKINLEAVTLINSISFRRGFYDIYVLMILYRYSCQHYHLGLFSLGNNKLNSRQINPYKGLKMATQCSATPYIQYIIYTLIYMDKVSVFCLDPLNFRCFYPKNRKPVLCYEVFKKWPLLSLFPGRLG